MSADNGIYILECKNAEGVTEFRVEHAQNIEDINWIPPGVVPERDNQFWNLASVRCVWQRSAVLHKRDEAFKLAHEMEAKEYICEYGVCHFWMDRPFPTQKEADDFAAVAEVTEATWQGDSLADEIVYGRTCSTNLQARQGCAVARLQRAARAALDLNDKDVSNDKVIEATLAELREATELCENWQGSLR